MEFRLTSSLLLPIGLGLFGFIEPCTIGAHLVFLGSQDGRSRTTQLVAFAVFLVLRVAVMSAFGAAAALLGAALIDVQTGFWLAFGALYVAIGLGSVAGNGRWLRRRVALAPSAWRWAANPAVQGAAFGLSIPACAAPLLFALLGVAAGGASLPAGVLSMALFAAALTLPLAPLLFWEPLRRPVQRLAEILRGRGWVLGLILIALGLWSIWFGLYVDPAEWSGL